jgi:hypothetical protein
MAAISASFTFTPSVSGGVVNANGNNLAEVKANAKAVLAARRVSPVAQVEAIDAADAALEA